MDLRLGPILSFRGATATAWRVSALWVLPKDEVQPLPTLTGGATVASVVELARGPREERVWRVDIDAPRPAAGETSIAYALGGETHAFSVPAEGPPLHFAFASCNGFSSPQAKRKFGAIANARWASLVALHAAEKLHLLILGGDQVYGDSIWRDCNLKWLASWLDKDERKRRDTAPSALQRKALDDFYFALYCERWSQPHVADALASVPALMMWDDHDIFDGFGSHEPELQSTRVFQAIFEAATRGFRVFQLQLGAGETPPGGIAGAALSYRHRVDALGFVALDLRSERTPERVMSEAAWQQTLPAIDALAASGIKHLFVISGPPVVYPSTALIEDIVDAIPGEQDVEDDLRDRWGSRPHLPARLRLVERLLRAAGANRVRVTILSGDVHTAALGVIESTQAGMPANANVINNLISSPIVHAPPPKLALVALRILNEDFELAPRIGVAMRKLPGSDKRYVARRNYLRLAYGASHEVAVEWRFERLAHPGEDRVLAKTIHPVA